ncbi:MAG: asparagine synthase (glutamine-hydrolyzing) [Candidatus Rokubacteria bacterium]|nr:asparagine synthase (glutamine-hydrolyzing) [Candidatus Rokubacteria bacterium]
MCGVTGFVSHRGLADPRATIERMTATLVHRGPDDQGIHVDGPAALGVRRLCVIDLDTGHQPVSNEDGTVWVVQNGEIYNFGALRDRLQRLGHVFRTRSDTEVIVHAWEEYGEDCVAHLDGMFVLAVWDSRQRTLLLARDRMGEKPLYYHAGHEAFVFGSELRALLPHPAVPRRLDLTSLARYLDFEYVPAPHAILAGVEKLPPGHVLTISPGGKPHLARYWDLAFAPDRSPSEREWQEALLHQLEASIQSQLVSDVPLGLFLSGGVDSSAIVALASRALTGRRVKTFSLGFPEASYDERPFARAVAARCGTAHTEVTVVLSGDGGD